VTGTPAPGARREVPGAFQASTSRVLDSGGSDHPAQATSRQEGFCSLVPAGIPSA
jgi:hypothetical protein